MSTAGERNKLYYLDTVTFLAENQLFKVYQCHFMESEVFRTAFSLPPGPWGAEGTSDANPFVLHGVKTVDFQGFLKAIGPLSPTTLSNMARHEWVSALKLSAMWNFAHVRNQSISYLSASRFNLSPADKIVLGRENRVLTWLREGYDALVERGEVISAEELTEYAEMVGWDTMAKVLRISASKVSCRVGNCGSHVCTSSRCSCCGRVINDLGHGEEIQRVFGDEFKAAEIEVMGSE